MDAFIGTVLAVAFNYPPRGWAFCNGQLMAISQNSAMFALLGTTYGGDGVTTFGIPDLQGRTILGGQGNGPGISPIAQGEKGGVNSVTLTANNLPPHTHPATLSLTGLTATTTVTVGTGTNGGLAAVASNGGLTSTAGGPTGAAIFLPASTAPTAPVNLGGVNTVINSSGGTVTVQPNVSPDIGISVMQPYLGMNYIIATQGIFPSRN